MGLGSWVGECRDLFGILPWSRVELWFGKVWAGITDTGGSWSWAQVYKGWSPELGCMPHVGEVQHVQLGQLCLTSGHPGALTYGLHPTHPHSAAQTNSWAAKESLVHRWPTPQSSQELAARESLLFSSCAAKLSPTIPAKESKSETCSHREAYCSWTWTSKHTRWDRAHVIHRTFSPFLLYPGLEREKRRKERRPRCSSQLWPPLPKSGFKICCFGNNSSKTPSLLHFRST